MDKTIAIMQPTYLPWLGYFAMIEKVDTLVFLDNVQFDKRSWQQRNRIKSHHGENLLTVPVLSKGKFKQNINEVLCKNLSLTVKKHLLTIEYCYKRSPLFQDFYPFLKETMFNAINVSGGFLSIFNIQLIKNLCSYVGINTQMSFASDLNVLGAKDVLLVNICEVLNATSYLSPPGSKVYLESSDAFCEKGIKILYHHYCDPNYKQLHQEHIKNLSCVDAFFNIFQCDLKDFIMSGVS